MKKSKLIISAAAFILTANLSARENVETGGKHKAQPINTLIAACLTGTTQTDIDINNVRATLLTSGDMWWDLKDGKYEVPKGSGKICVFAGALWIGGLDPGNNLRVAAMTYRQNGIDIWPGPLDPATASTNSAQVCSDYDKHFKITRKEVEEFVRGIKAPTAAINEWPAYTPFGQPLAPFFDVDGIPGYDPQAGDYPDYDIFGDRGCAAKLKGDQTLFWVFNDKGNGNIHTESNSVIPIGLEIQAQGFGFATNDQINDMTFYNYTIINRATTTLNNTYFGQWVDSDLGKYDDDYVGCDVRKGLGYTYNGDANDEGATGYGLNPPALGVDFFEGPFTDPNGIADIIDPSVEGSANGLNYGDSIIDNERLGMAKFVYYNNDGTNNGNPDLAKDFYNYLSGSWKDDSPFTYGGDAYQEPSAIQCDFMFPGETDPDGFGTYPNPPQLPWTEVTAGNLPADRRFLQSAGPFTLQPGAVNTITTGVLWARATQGGQTASVDLLKAADIEAQKLFNACFIIEPGPDAPDINIVEMDRKLIFTLTNNPVSSNNAGENYRAHDVGITSVFSEYTFQGYKIYQLKDPSASVTDLGNPDKARLLKQSDIIDNAVTLINFHFDADPDAQIWYPEVKVVGANTGIENNFEITQDLFALGDNRLVNHKTYYYMAVAYAYNPAEVATNPYTSNVPNEPYLEGIHNIKVKAAIPHKIEATGIDLHSAYGSGPKVTRIEGQGNGENIVDITQTTVDSIFKSPLNRAFSVEYEAGKTPIGIRVLDPLNVIDGNFTFKILDTLTPNDTLKQARWILVNTSTNDTVYSNKVITVNNEQIIVDQKTGKSWGFSIKVYQPLNSSGKIALPGKPTTNNLGFLEATMSFTDPGKQWLTGVADDDATGSISDWIRSGAVNPDYPGLDDNEVFEKVLSGTWAPYRMAAATVNMPALSSFQGSFNKLTDLSSVDLVITADKSKWTRSPVLEMNDLSAGEGGARKFDLRSHASVDKNGLSVSTGGTINDADFVNATGMGWFPGYAINIATGERLNIAFGEDSGLPNENGKDMIWNPTSNIVNAAGDTVKFGGKHFIYIFGHNSHYTTQTKEMPRYDNGLYIRNKLNGVPTTSLRREVYEYAMWVNMPLAVSGFNLKSGIPPTDVKVRLRMSRYYNKGYSVYSPTAPASTFNDTTATPQNNNLPMYTFSTSELVAHENDPDIAKNALDLINVVPNPYYAFSEYETGQLDNKIKITNLPQICKVRIYSVNGHLIRTFKRDDPTVTSLDWDLKNQAGIPVASGLYIIHVDVPGVGEKILKWFGVMRPIDLDSF